jgi:hypothetical protein
MHKTKLVIGVFLIFLVGVCAGSLGGFYYFKYLENKFNSREFSVYDRTVTLLTKLSEKLDLTDIQQYEVNKIIQKTEQETFDVRRNFLPELTEITERTLLLIKQELNTDQIQKLDDLSQYVDDLHDRAAAELVLSEKTTANELLQIKSLLNLTPDQEEKVQEILEEYTIKRQEFINDYNEGDDSRFPRLRRQINTLGTSTEERLADVLSKDQMEIYMKAKVSD